MRAGSLTNSIEIWQNVQVGTSEVNEPIFEARIWKETWASLEMRQGREFYENNQVFSLTSYYFTCRYFSVEGIDDSMWIVFKGQAYDIKNLNADRNKKDDVVIEARVKDQTV